MAAPMIFAGRGILLAIYLPAMAAATYYFLHIFRLGGYHFSDYFRYLAAEPIRWLPLIFIFVPASALLLDYSLPGFIAGIIYLCAIFIIYFPGRTKNHARRHSGRILRIAAVNYLLLLAVFVICILFAYMPSSSPLLYLASFTCAFLPITTATASLPYFSGISSRLSYSPLNHRVYWTEHRADHRWDAVSYSVLCCRDSLGNTRTIAAGRRYYNPAPHPSSGIVAVAEYPFEGGTRISVLSEEGSLLESFPAPAGLQATEPVWMDGRLYASAISEEGSGIYSLPGWKEIMAPVQAKVNHLSSRSGRIWFTCDIDGVNELYSLDVQNGTLWRETSVRFGGTDFVFAGDSLYFTSPGTDSRGIWVLSEDSLLGEEAPEEDAYPIATKLAMQETVRPDDEIEVDISDPEPYSKMGHLIQVHSWAPAFLDLDFVSAYSYEKTTVDAAPGAMVFFQNELSTSFGSAGVSLTDADLRFRPAAHLQYAYRGFLPVLEFRADLNDRETLHHRFDYDEENKAFVRSNVPDGKSLMSMSLVSYVPVNLSSGGWSRGVVPMVKAAWSNDRFGFLAYEGGGVQNLNVDGGIFINTEVRAYSMLPVTSSKIFPHLGLGGKVGASFSPFIYRYFGHTGYIGIYGYLPGLVSTHGLHLNLDASRSFGSDFFTLSSLGFQADYALPFGALDWSGLSPWMYLRNFELTGHADLSFSNAAYKLSDRNEPLRRHSVGASLAMHLGNFLWMPFDTLLGLKYMYCLTDPSLSALTMVFSMDIK